MKMTDKVDKAVRFMDYISVAQGRDWISPTEIGRAVGGGNKHSSYGSPICKKAVEMGCMERNECGHYRLIKAVTQ